VGLGNGFTLFHFMENQHRKIKGYRELSQDEVGGINCIKEVAQAVGELVKRVGETSTVDKRWLAIAQTDLQKGFMALRRSIAKPDFF